MIKLKGLRRKVVNREPFLNSGRIPRWSVKIWTPAGASEVKLQVLVGDLLHECLQEGVDDLQKGHFTSKGSNDGRAYATQMIRKTIGCIERIHGLNEPSQQNR
jgi:hypothetical protein